MRALVVVAVDKQRKPSGAVFQIGKHRAGQKFVPQSLPEALDLPQRLRVVRPRLEMPHSLPAQLLLEFGRAPPARVLPPLIGQHLPGRIVLRHSFGKCFQYQCAPLMPRHRVSDDEARTVIEKGGQVDPLVAPQQESEDVRLPELVRLRPLEAGLRRRRPPHYRLLLHQPRLVQHPPHLRLADPDRLEADQHVADPAAPVLRVRPLQRQHRLAPWVFLRRPFLRTRPLRKQCLVSALGESLSPQRHRRLRQPEGPAHVAHRGARLQLLQHPHLDFQRMRTSLRSFLALACLLPAPHPSPPPGSPVSRIGADAAR